MRPPAAAALVPLALIGGCMSSNGPTGTGSGLASVKQLVDAVPLPAGATLVDESAYDTRGQTPAFVQREYRLPDDTATADIRAALEQAHYQVLGAHAGEQGDAVWRTDTSTGSGDIYVLPPGLHRGGIEMRWSGTRLIISLQDGQAR